MTQKMPFINKKTLGILAQMTRADRKMKSAADSEE